MTPDRWRRIEALYHAADALPPDRRAAFLGQACPDDEELRGEVEALLREPESSDRLPSQAALSVLAHLQPAPRVDMLDRVLGGYRLQALLGAGGMGEVYRAHDMKLGRDVAIKLLAHEFTSSPDRLARLEREARMLAALNHPNICGIYGLEECDGVRFLVLELVEGKTLAEMLAGERSRGRDRSTRTALTVALQIAEALEVAHEKGVVHRDLKPANVKITPADVVKVLDFGLAKVVTGDGRTPEITHPPSVAGREGAVIGTAAYMSPEQARGLSVDKRTDIWAFGVVLFEMLAGARPFRGETATDTLAAVLTTDPDWSELPDGVAPDLRKLLQRCLQKDARRRLQSIADARVEIEDLMKGPGSEPVYPATLRAGNRAAWIVAAIAIVVAASLGLPRFRKPVDAAAYHYTETPAPGTSLAVEESPLISPDGQRFAFVAYDAKGAQRLYVRTMAAAGPARPLPKTEGASLPFWSPDSRALGFFAQGNLWTIDIVTGGVLKLASAGGARGGTWSRDGVIVYVPSPRDGPYRVPATGQGTPVRLQADGAPSPGGWFPFFLPDGRHFLEFATTGTRPENSAVWVVSLETGKRDRLVDSQSNAVYASGYLLFWREEALWALAFDADTRKTGGDPFRIAEGVGLNPVTNQAMFSASNTGTLAYYAGAVGKSELVWLDRQGHEISRPGVTGVIGTIALSPDDTKVAYDYVDPRTKTFDIWQFVSGSRGPEKLTLDTANDVFPLWSIDGTRIAFMSVRERPPQVYELRADAVGSEVRLFKSLVPAVPSGRSPDGKTLFYTATDPKTKTGDIMSVSLESGLLTEVVKTEHDERYAVPSPDGRWLAYVSNASGRFEVIIQALGGQEYRRTVSTNGGSQPQWRRDGRELIYMAPDRMLMAIQFRDGAGSFVAAEPQQLLATRTKSLEAQGTERNYAVSRDGQSFLVANATDDTKSAAMSVVLNWPSHLRR